MKSDGAAVNVSLRNFDRGKGVVPTGHVSSLLQHLEVHQEVFKFGLQTEWYQDVDETFVIIYRKSETTDGA